MPILDAPRLLQEIQRICQDDRRMPLRVFWYTSQGPRDDLARDIASLAPSLPVVGYVVKRPDEFCSANAFSTDVVCAVESVRQLIEEVLRDEEPTAAKPLCIVLLSKEKLTIPTGVASPIALPQWIPGIGGRELPLVVENVDILAASELDCEEMQLSEISSALCEIERRIQELLIRRMEVATHEVEGLVGQLCRRGQSPRELLLDCRRNVSAVTSPDRFRPSCNERDATLTGLLVREVSRRKLDELPELGQRLSAALGLYADVTIKQPRLLAGLLLRSRRPLQESTPEQQLGEACLQTIYAASMLVTISHHADRMPRFPLTVIEGISLDIRNQLDELRRMLL